MSSFISDWLSPGRKSDDKKKSDDRQSKQPAAPNNAPQSFSFSSKFVDGSLSDDDSNSSSVALSSNNMRQRKQASKLASSSSTMSTSSQASSKQSTAKSGKQRKPTKTKNNTCKPTVWKAVRLCWLVTKFNAFLAMLVAAWVLGQVLPASDIADYLVFSASMGVEMFNDLTAPNFQLFDSFATDNSGETKNVGKRIGQKMFESGSRPVSDLFRKTPIYWMLSCVRIEKFFKLSLCLLFI
jgi:hypothetical protein